MAVARKQAPSAEDAEMRPGLLAMVLRRWWLIVLCVIIGAASAGAISARQQKQYEATAQLLFRDDTTPDQSLQSVLGIPPATSSLDPAQQEATNVALVSVDTVSNMTARALGRHLTGGQIQSEISVSEIGQSNVVSITAKDASATRAAAIANTFARQFVLFAQHTDKSIIDSGIRSLQTQLQSLAPNVQSGPTGRTLKDQIQQLSEFAQLQVGNAQLVQTATPPSSPSVPRTKLNVAAGAVLGAILGIVLAVIWYRFDGRLRSPEELSAEYQLPLLGVVSRSRGLNVASRRSNREARLPPAAAEQFRTIRARLRYLNRDHDLRSILVTSAAAGDGKSTIAWGLARAIAMNAEGGVLLIEADLRRPSLARDHGLRAYPGLADVLAQGISLDIVIQTVVAASFGKQREGSDFPAETGHGQSENGDETLAGGGSSETRFKYRRGSAPPQSQPLRAQQAHLKMSASVHPANGLLDTGPTMDVIVAGAIPSNSAELLDSSAMSRLMQAATEQYKYVVLDGPPASIVSDWLPLVAHASGIVVVSSMRNASKGNAERLRSELDNLNAPVLGLVVNNANRRDERSWGYQRPSESYHPAARTAADAGNSAGDDPENGNSVTDSTVESKAARA